VDTLGPKISQAARAVKDILDPTPAIDNTVELARRAGFSDVDFDFLNYYNPEHVAAAVFIGGVGKASREFRAVEETAAELAKGGTYVLRDAETSAVLRTGRTGNLTKRAYQHSRDPALTDFVFDVVHRTDNYAEQRGLEQYLHNLYNPSLNKIRPISPLNPNGPRYMQAAQDFLETQ
jgi:hypothetical protein